MYARIVMALGIALLAVSCAPYSEMGTTQTYFGFSITSVSEAPPPPRIRIVDGPDYYYVVPGSSVYVVQDPGADCDVFRYGSGFYMFYGGYWYRSYRSDGSFVAIDVRSVPRPVLSVPEDRWRHHPHGGPPGQRSKWDRHDRDRDRGGF